MSFYPKTGRESKPATTAEPADIQCGRWWKDRHHATECRVEIKTWEGHRYLDVRFWDTGSDGCMRPSTKGVTVSPRNLGKLLSAVTKAARHVRELGLVDEDGEAEE